MDKLILDRLTKSLQDTKIAEIAPDETILESVLKLQGHNLSSLTDETLSSYIYVLSQYKTFLHVQHNTRHIKYLQAKRVYELKLSEASSKLAGKTVKERSFTARQGSDEVKQLEAKMNEKQADYLLFENVPDSIGELANALKKELSIRLAVKYGKKYD